MILGDFIKKYNTGGVTYSQFAHYVGGKESNNKHYDKNGNLLKNPTSSAKGKYQIINDTWNRISKALGRPLDRHSMEDNEAAMRYLYGTYIKDLNRNGLDISLGNLYGMHFLGNAKRVKYIRNNPNAHIRDVLSASELKANSFVNKFRNNVDVMRWLDKGRGGIPSSDAPSQQQQNVPVNFNMDYGPEIQLPNSNTQNFEYDMSKMMGGLPTLMAYATKEDRDKIIQEEILNKKLENDRIEQENEKLKLEAQNKEIEQKLLERQRDREMFMSIVPRANAIDSGTVTSNNGYIQYLQNS